MLERITDFLRLLAFITAVYAPIVLVVIAFNISFIFGVVVTITGSLITLAALIIDMLIHRRYDNEDNN